MSTETTIETMRVDLKGDASSYQNMLQQAQAATKTASASIGASMAAIPASLTNSAKKELPTFIQALPGMVSGIASTVASALGTTMQAAGMLVGSALSAITGSIGSALSGILGAITSMVSGLVSGITSALASVPTMLMSAYAGLRSITSGIIATDATARKLGLTTLDLNAAMLWSGASAQIMQSALGVTQKKLTDLRFGLRETREDFRVLAEAAGTTVDKLKSGGWTAVYDAISSIQDPTKRASQAFRFMGDAAGDLLGELDRKGPGASKAAAERMGLGASAGDVAQARQISETLRQGEFLMKGAFNQIILALGPLFAELARSFDLTKANLTWIRPMVESIAKSAALTGAFFAEAFGGNQKVWAAGMKALKEGVDTLGEYIVQVLSAAFDKVVEAASSALSGLLDRFRILVGIETEQGKRLKLLADEQQKWWDEHNKRFIRGRVGDVLRDMITVQDALENDKPLPKGKRYEGLEKRFNDLMRDAEKKDVWFDYGMKKDLLDKKSAVDFWGKVGVDRSEVGKAGMTIKTVDTSPLANAVSSIRDTLHILSWENFLGKPFKPEDRAKFVDDLYKFTDPFTTKERKGRTRSDELKEALALYEKAVPKSLTTMKPGSAFGELMEELKASASGKSVEEFFERAKKAVEKFNEAGREMLPAFDTKELGKRFDALKQSVRTPVDNWKDSMAELRKMIDPKLGVAGFDDDKALIAARSLTTLLSGVGLSALPQLAGAAEDRTKEAYSSAAQWAMINDPDRKDVQLQIKMAIDAGNQQREAQIGIGKEIIAMMKQLGLEELNP